MRRSAPNSERPDTAETREKLLEAAMKVFAREGYQAAALRDISSEAGVNSALIGYHFGGKEGIYLEVVAQVCELVGARMQAALDAGAATLDTLDSTQAADAACQLLEPVMEMVLDDGSNDWARLMLHEQLHPGAGFKMLHDALARPCIEMLADLIAKAHRRPRTDEDAIAALAIIGMLLIFRSANASYVLLVPAEVSKETHRAVLQDAVRRAIYEL